LKQGGMQVKYQQDIDKSRYTEDFKANVEGLREAYRSVRSKLPRGEDFPV